MRSSRGGERPRRGVQAIALGAQARAVIVPIVDRAARTPRSPTYADYEERKLLAQLKIADRNGARYALILGSDELVRGELVLRDLLDRSDLRLPLGSGRDVAAALMERSKDGRGPRPRCRRCTICSR